MDNPTTTIIYKDEECPCKLCQAYYAWFDSDSTDPPPPTCGSNIIEVIKEADDGPTAE